MSLFYCQSLLAVSAVNGQTIRRVEIVNPPVITNNASTFEVAVVNSTGLVYNSGNAFGAEISVFNPTTNTLVASILPAPVNGFNGGGASVSRVNQTTNIIYFLLANALVVVDGRPGSPTFSQTLPAISFANQTIATFAVDQTRQRLYVSTRTIGSNPVQSLVQIVDTNPASTTFHQTLGTVALPAGQTIGHLAVNSMTNKIYTATQTTGGGVYVINGATQAINLIAGTLPSFLIAVNEVSNTIYASRSGIAGIQAIDGANDTLTINIPLPSPASGATLGEQVAVNATTERAFFTLSDGTLSVIDAKRTSATFNTVLANIANVGTGEIAIDESTNKIVAASNNIRTTIINGATNTIEATTSAGLSSSDVAINPNTHRAFVAYQLFTLQTINLNDNSFVNTALAAEVGEGVVNPNNNSFYFGRNRANADLAFLDAADNPGTISGLPHNLGRYIFAAQNVSTNRIYMVNTSVNLAGTTGSGAAGFVAVVNGATNSVIANVEIGGQPFSNPAVNETTNKIYISNVGYGSASAFPSSISVINGATNTASFVNTSAFPANTLFLRTITVNPVTNRIYFQISDGTSVGVINGATDVAVPVPSFTSVSNILVNRNLNRVYFFNSTSLRVLNGADDSLIATIPLSAASEVVLNETTGRLFVRSNVNRTLTAIDGITNTVVATVALVNAPDSVAIDELRNRIYLGHITDFNDETTSGISFLDGNSLAVRKVLPLPLFPSRIRVNPATKTVYVTTANAFQRTGIVVIADPTVSSVPFDFDGDGKADLAVFRPSNSVWYLNQSTNRFTGIQFGNPTDKITPADYDGDGKTDVAVYRAGIWYLQRSSLGFTGIAFGTAEDIPVPADYDGDGKADLAVFRPSNGTWYLLRSQLGFTGIQFGQNGDKPVAADFDGDGKTDLAVYRAGVWYQLRSQLGFTGVQFGNAADKPVAADYDGDGRADIAVFRPANGTWYLLQSQSGLSGIQFGNSTDLPTPADYDGDGKTDIAVYRGGTWYLNRSTQGFTGVAFGITTDQPIPNAYVY